MGQTNTLAARSQNPAMAGMLVASTASIAVNRNQPAACHVRTKARKPANLTNLPVRRVETLRRYR